MIDRLIEDERGRQRLVAFIKNQSLPFVANIKSGRHRSLDQNKLQWLWASEAAAQRQDMTPAEVQAEWKLRFGVPILCAENAGFAAAWLRPAVQISYEAQLMLMNVISVTSIMTSGQLKQYLDQVYQWNAERGIELTSPEDMQWPNTTRASLKATT